MLLLGKSTTLRREWDRNLLYDWLLHLIFDLVPLFPSISIHRYEHGTPNTEHENLESRITNHEH